ncbi:hypothetical protein AMS68_001396 [Peltaster fructicola]|uniref:Lanthionine synthetase C-like protein n=1 Tax=Peltaster fructicola TaxID=286661 RepID=A0A6H0XMN0_9PEZI|nr:hypothetical protein AMS68_001396 [Peltaster fructicola]
MPPRYFKNDAPLASRDPYKQLKASLSRLVNDHPATEIRPGGGLYKGCLSVAYLFLMLQQIYTDLEVEGQHLSVWATAYLKFAQDSMSKFPGPSPGKCGIMDDIMSLLAVGAATTKDIGMVEDLCDYAAEVLDPETENEFLYGRAGYLYLLRLVKASFLGDEKTLQLITDTQDDVVDAILETQRPWKWMGKNYVGAIHGAMGIITQIVLTNPKKYASLVEVDLAVLLTYQYESGNWPSSLPLERDRLVQVCHGAPGMIISLLSVKEHFPQLEEKIDKAIAKGRACIKERGLLTKEPCICHGITGNALALEQEDFENFLTYTTGQEMKSMEKDGMLEKSSAPESLFMGEAGRAWVWAVADKGLNKRILGYNDL